MSGPPGTMHRPQEETQREVGANIRRSARTPFAIFLWVLAALPLGCRSSMTGFSLLSADEYRAIKVEEARASAAPETPSAKAVDVDAPKILVDAPDPRVTVRPPLHLELRFEAASNARIDVSSFQVLYKYGLLRKDITDRIRPFVTLTAAGVSGASSSAIPEGEHTLIIRIRDTMNRLGEQAVTFRVSAAVVSR
jgi:hypothetical protein